MEKAQPLFGMLRAKIGLDRCRLAITSTAPCRPEVHEFWAALGLPLFEVWGMSELTGPATAVPLWTPIARPRSAARSRASRSGSAKTARSWSAVAT